MTSVVLAYRGHPGARQSAEARLRQLIPGVVLTPKTGTLMEAQVDDSQVQALEAEPDWEVTHHTFAEIRKPAFNLKNARAKLAGRR